MVVLVIVTLFLPAKTHVERSIVVNTQPKLVYSYVQDFQKFNEWSPWARIDPDTQYTYSDPSSGVGARMAWQSEHPDVGSGAQQILAVRIDEYVEMALDFGDMGTANASYELLPDGGATIVTWNFDTDNGFNPIARIFGVMMDGMLGPIYEEGLLNLKKVVETAEVGE